VLQAGAQLPEPVSEAPAPVASISQAPMSNRVQLRLVLLASALILFTAALFSYALVGIAWAVAPSAVGLLAGIVAMGGMSGRALSLFWFDLRTAFGGSFPQTEESTIAAVQVRGQSAQAIVAQPVAVPGGATTSPSVPTFVQSERSAEAAPSRPISILGISERHAGFVMVAAGLLAAALSLYMFPKGPPYSVAWWSYGLSVALMLGAMPAFEGGWSAFFARFRRGYQVTFEPRAMLPWAALAFILLFALAIRLYNLDGFPPGLWFDEADNLDQARRLADDLGYLPVFVPFTELPSLFLLPIAVVIKFAGISITTGRLVAVVFGLAGVVAMFLMMRHMLGSAMGLVAAFLTAVMRWDVIWSRTGMHGITAPFFAALTAWLTYRAVRNGGRADFAVAGTALGLGMWYYAAYRLFPLVIGFVLVHGLITAGKRRGRLVQNIGIMAVFAAMVVLPLAQFVLTQPGEFFDRTAVTSVFSVADEGDTARVIRESLIRHLGMFHFEGDPNGRHNLPGAPMLDVFSGLLMLLGLVVAVWRWRIAAFLVLPVWILVMIMPGVLTIPWEAPQSLRTITVIPAVIALVTVAIGFIWDLGRSAQMPVLRTGTAALIAVLLAVIAYANINTYFVAQANDPEVYASYSTDDTLMARDMADQAERGYSPMVSRQFRHSLVASLFGHRYPRQTIAAPTNIPLDPKMVWQGAAIYLEPREAGFYDTLRAYYPTADFREIRPPMGGNVLYYSAYVGREELEAAQGLISRRTLESGEVVEEILRSAESVWKLEVNALNVPFDVEWKGTLHVTHPGEYVFRLEGGASSEVLLDGRPILSDNERVVVIEPAVGLHELEVRSRVEETDGVLRLLWRQPPIPLNDGKQATEQESVSEPPLVPISASNLYHGDVRPVGLVGRFFRGIEDPREIDRVLPDAQRVTPGIGGAFWYNSVVEGAHLAIWDGVLNVPEAGLYRLRLNEVHGEMKLILDGETIIDSRSDRETEVELSAGRNRIRLEYVAASGSPRFEVLWTPPGQAESRIAPENLSPAPEYMFRVVK